MAEGRGGKNTQKKSFSRIYTFLVHRAMSLALQILSEEEKPQWLPKSRLDGLKIFNHFAPSRFPMD